MKLVLKVEFPDVQEFKNIEAEQQLILFTEAIRELIKDKKLPDIPNYKVTITQEKGFEYEFKD